MYHSQVALAASLMLVLSIKAGMHQELKAQCQRIKVQFTL